MPRVVREANPKMKPASPFFPEIRVYSRSFAVKILPPISLHRPNLGTLFASAPLLC
jgi:hypothetical protein